MGKQKVRLKKNKDGTVSIFFAAYSFSKELDVGTLSPEEKFNAIRWTILNQGFVFTEKIEREVRKLINYHL